MYRTDIFSQQHGGIATCDWTPKHCGNGVTETYREANARLIAAAPDMLDALKQAEPMLTAMPKHINDNWPNGGTMPALDTVRAAIAKATGSTA